MQLSRASRHSPQHVLSPHDPHSWSKEQIAPGGSDQMETRHDAQMLVARTVPADPYTAWLARREADRRSSTGPVPTKVASSRFSRNQPVGAPWYTVLVAGSHDSR
jgi:hypothetical protein